MTKKKEIPLTLLEALQPFADQNSDIIKSVKSDDLLFHLLDIDPNSDSYFKTIKFERRTDGAYYQIEYKPSSKETPNAHSVFTKIEGVTNIAKNWVDLIKAYNALHTVHDDPILKAYEDHFFKQVDIVEADADYAPFELEKQLFLDQYLQNVDSSLEKLKSEKSKEEVDELTNLQEEAKHIRHDITRLTKRKAVRRLSKFWAKAQKLGLDVIKEIFINLAADFTKKMLTGDN